MAVWASRYKVGGPTDMNWAADAVDLSKLPDTPHVPWSVYYGSAETLTLAPHRKGSTPKKWVRVNPFGHTQLYAQSLPMIVDGKFQAYLPSADNDPSIAVVSLRRGYQAEDRPLYIRAGQRGESINTPYMTWHGHHRRREDGTISYGVQVPMFVGIDLLGGIHTLHRDGSFNHVGSVPVTTWANDFSYSSLSRKQLFVTDTDAGRVLHVDRATAPWTITEFASDLGRADSVREFDGTVYVADSVRSRIWAIDAVTKEKRVLCSVPHAFWVDHDSEGNLIVLTTTRDLFRVSTSTGTASPNIMPKEWRMPLNPAKFGTVEVDRTGCLGPVDTMYVQNMAGAMSAVYRVNKNGIHERYDCGGWDTASASGVMMNGGHCAVGLAANCDDSFGHYMWVATPCGSDDESGDAALLVQGKAETHPQLLLAVDDEWEPMDYGAYPISLGWQVWHHGTDPNSPQRGVVPSFTTQCNTSGGGLITFDHIAAMPLAEAAAYLRAGMASIHGTRALNSEAVRAALFFAHVNSQPYLRGGNAYAKRVWAELQAIP